MYILRIYIAASQGCCSVKKNQHHPFAEPFTSCTMSHTYRPPLVIYLWWSCRYGFHFNSLAQDSGINDAANPFRFQVGNVCSGGNHMCALNQAGSRQRNPPRAGSDGERSWRIDRFNLRRWGAIRLGEGGCLETWGQYSQTSFYNKYIFNLCSFINQQNHFKMNSTLLSLLVALTVLYHEFVSLCNSSPASLHTKYVLYEPSFIMACQLLTVSLFSLEL